jgi:uncharacterized protein
MEADMAVQHSTRRKATKSPSKKRGSAASDSAPPIGHQPGKGLVASIEARFPETADHKITVAKHIVQAVLAAHDSEALTGENYNIHWPLSMAIELLERASSQLDVAATNAAMAKGGAA